MLRLALRTHPRVYVGHPLEITLTHVAPPRSTLRADTILFGLWDRGLFFLHAPFPTTAHSVQPLLS